MRLYDTNDIKYGFLDPKNPKNDILHSTVTPITQNNFNIMVYSGHFEFPCFHTVSTPFSERAWG